MMGALRIGAAKAACRFRGGELRWSVARLGLLCVHEFLLKLRFRIPRKRKVGVVSTLRLSRVSSLKFAEIQEVACGRPGDAGGVIEKSFTIFLDFYGIVDILCAEI